MKYQTLLFDVDDTLLDFQATERVALKRLFAFAGVTETPALVAKYKEMNHELWRSFERGERTRDEVIYQRFGMFFESLGKKVDGVALENQYRIFLEEGHDLMPDSREIITDLSQRADLYIVTNGVSQTQYRRLTDAKLLPFFKDVFVSEDTGYQKPMIEYFDYVFDRIPNFAKEQAVIIGDSLTSDIQGGITAGIDTIWLNPQKTTGMIQPTYEIQQLTELYGILGS
ncbi:2-haloacid dehalogenase [Enterococcus sp. PF1-24]|uniref:YjjG family noncanonical pyrimidine nucleotidase n=1 Tax=unclassified Enterococcus TaxID=2608891 RepID=UPI0024758018|nr:MULTISPECIES: YjjG family noncanonical pyrimidine nucleotidase [unclassified Enterococcus]MDH6364870.1 2-haloacid dehalogenase [Enterococcus sp. PFB1-1]MDH6401971.1 2-haloacid dehalogenase [Enterococcus sp. PF1-24]